MIFVLRMAWRETRASWKRLLFFFVCVALGVGAIVTLRSVIQSVRVALANEARTLLAADLLVQTNRPWTDEARTRLDRTTTTPAVLERTESVETTTMVRPVDEAKVVARVTELRAVEAAFPLYGEVVLDGGRRYSHGLLHNRGALVRPELLAQLGVAVGDGIRIGRATFTIRGVILSEPGRRLGAFTLGPRVLIDRADLPSTGLLTFGSRASYQVLLRVMPAALDGLTHALQEDFKGQFVNVRSYRRTEDQISDDLQRAENYLSLVGLIIVVLGGIGVWSVTRVFVQQKMRSIAVLKCVGGRTRQIIATYLVQVFVLALGGSLLGVALAAAAIHSVPATAIPTTLASLRLGLTAGAVANGVSIGILVSLLFSVAPLLEIRHVKPLLLLRHENPQGHPPPAGLGWIRRVRRWAVEQADWTRTLAVVLVTLALVIVAAWQVGSAKVGVFVSAGFAAVTLILQVASVALVRVVRPLAQSRWFPLRHAVLSLSRPGNQTRVILMAVGLGSFFLIGVRALQSDLERDLALELGADAPDMFLIDIQRDQVAGVRQFVDEGGARAARLVPVLRARVTGVRGREMNLESFEDVRGRGSLAREYVITYRGRLERNEQIVDGRFWPDAASSAPEVSIEESIRNRFGIHVGDLMRFDVLGRLIDARVTSVRRVDWDDSRSGGFMFLFRPGVFEAAPHMYVAFLKGPDDTLRRARFQRDLVARFPNVSVIDLREVIKTVEAVVTNVVLAISIVGAIALLSGALILVGAVAMTKFQRLYEAAIFKTLGASTRTIATMLVLEYGTLGALAGAIGAAAALGLSWAVSHHLLEITWRPSVGLNLVGLGATAIIVGTVGVVSSLDVLRRKPLSILRTE